jgi:hypothetical protein
MARRSEALLAFLLAASALSACAEGVPSASPAVPKSRASSKASRPETQTDRCRNEAVEAYAKTLMTRAFYADHGIESARTAARDEFGRNEKVVYGSLPPGECRDFAFPQEKKDREAKAKAKTIVERGKVAVATAMKAIKTDGSPEVRSNFISATTACGAIPEEPTADPKLLPYLARCAVDNVNVATKTMTAESLIANEPKIARAEKLAALAEEAANKRVAEREVEAKAKAAREEKENDAFVAAEPVCDKDLPACKKLCDAGGEASGAYCVYIGLKAGKAFQFDDAKAAFSKACSVGFTTACPHVAEAEAYKVKFEAKKSALFAEAASIADDVASKIFIANTSAGLGGAAASRVPMMRKVIAADIRDRYCPAKQDAVKLTGDAEFSRRAAAHCKDDPPTAGGLAGKQVSLPGECRQVFASGCP